MADFSTGAGMILGGTSALAQAKQAEEARKANQEEMRRIEELIGNVKAAQYNTQATKAPEAVDREIALGGYDFTKITPEEFAVIGKLNPQAAAYIAEKNPQLLQQTADTKEGREAQRAALQELRKRAAGPSVEMQAKMDQASRKAQIGAQSRQQSILQDAQRRGQLGSGAMLAAQLQGGSDAMERASMEGQNAAIEADRQALQAMIQSGQMGRELANDDLSMQRSNADIINAFNQRTSASAQNWANQKAQMENEAQLRNLQNAQDIANRNVDTRNQAQWQNREMFNKVQQQLRADQVGERNYARTRYMDAEDQRKYANQMAGQQFDDQMARANAMSGLGYQRMGQNTQAAADRNKTIQAFGDMGTSYANYSGAQSDKEKDRESNEKIARMKYGYEE